MSNDPIHPQEPDSPWAQPGPQPGPQPSPQPGQNQVPNTPSSQVTLLAGADEWQPTSKWTLVQLSSQIAGIFVLYLFFQFGRIGVQIGVPDAAIAPITEHLPFITGSLISVFFDLGIPMLIAAYPIIQWLSIRWRLDEQTIELRQGIIFKKHQKMARSRVQSVSLKATIIGRLTNTRSVVISSGDTEDIVIELVSIERAEQLRITVAPRIDQASQPDPALVRDPIRDALFKRQQPGQITGQGVGIAPGVEPAIAAPATRVRHDIVHLDVLAWLKFVGLSVAPHVILITVIMVPLAILIAFIGIKISHDLAGPLLVLAPSLVFVFIPVAIGIMVAQINNWGFTSWIQDGRIHTVQGLISRYEQGAALSRLQSVSVGQNPIRLWAKLDEINVSTADAAVAKKENESFGTTFKLVHPILASGQWQALAQDLLNVTIPTELNPPSPLTVGRGTVRVLLWGLPIAAICGIVEWIVVQGFYSGIVIGVLTLIAAYPVGLWRWHNLRWAVNEECFVIRRGLLFRTISIVPLNLVQNVKTNATFFQRRLGLADVQADIAGIQSPLVCAHDLPVDAATYIEATLVDHAKRGVNRDGV